ncbi:hypothetical protein AHAS_Ahas09G0278800 [Arachis hypogaea]|uniref:Nuclear transport factor 2 domain-containing protein n=1 Tax=Arachis hypogaea TaxID=3818 RepID=A0A445BDQ0_ARAHY|nr:hypothetical protein Ahy_A09g041727 [Arachis hypogaea]
MLTVAGQKIQGAQNIIAKLTSLPFNQCLHSITTVDCQPSSADSNMLVFLSSNLQLASQQPPARQPATRPQVQPSTLYHSHSTFLSLIALMSSVLSFVVS